MMFGAILFTPVRFTLKLRFSVKRERSLIACAATLDVNPPPQRALPFIVNKQSWPLSLLTNTVPDTRLVIYGCNKVESVEI
jgi:hypothetical protein